MVFLVVGQHLALACGRSLWVACNVFWHRVIHLIQIPYAVS